MDMTVHEREAVLAVMKNNTHTHTHTQCTSQGTTEVEWHCGGSVIGGTNVCRLLVMLNGP